MTGWSTYSVSSQDSEALDDWSVVDSVLSSCNSDFVLVNCPVAEETSNTPARSYIRALVSRPATLAVTEARARPQGRTSTSRIAKEAPPKEAEAVYEFCFSDEKPGSQQRDPRRRAGRCDKQSKGRDSSPPPRNVGNIRLGKTRIGGKICPFCNPRLSCRLMRSSMARKESRIGNEMCTKGSRAAFMADNT